MVSSGYVVCIGRSIRDDYYRIDTLPVLGGKVNVSYLEWRPGGGMANTASVVAALGSRCYMLGGMGQDDYTQPLIQSVAKYGVCTDYLDIYPGRPNVVHQILLYGEERIILLQKMPYRLMVRDTPAKRALLQGASFVYSDMLSYKFLPNDHQLLTQLAAGGTRIFVDAEPTSATDKSDDDFYLQLASVISFNQGAVDYYFGDRGQQGVLDLIGDSDKIALLTRGKDGVLVCTRNGCTAVPGYPVKAVDTTGAGDTFSGAFMHALLQQQDPVQAARFACAASAVCVSSVGGRSGAVSRRQVTELMDRYKNIV